VGHRPPLSLAKAKTPRGQSIDRQPAAPSGIPSGPAKPRAPSPRPLEFKGSKGGFGGGGPAATLEGAAAPPALAAAEATNAAALAQTKHAAITLPPSAKSESAAAAAAAQQGTFKTEAAAALNLAARESDGEALELALSLSTTATPPPLFEGALPKGRFELSRLYKSKWKERFLRLYPDRLEYGKWNRKNPRSKLFGRLVLRHGSPLLLNASMEVTVENINTAGGKPGSEAQPTQPRLIRLRLQPGHGSVRAPKWVEALFLDDPKDTKLKGTKLLAQLRQLEASFKAEDAAVRRRGDAKHDDTPQRRANPISTTGVITPI
jgi:hypothetical protein